RAVVEFEIHTGVALSIVQLRLISNSLAFSFGDKKLPDALQHALLLVPVMRIADMKRGGISVQKGLQSLFFAFTDVVVELHNLEVGRRQVNVEFNRLGLLADRTALNIVRGKVVGTAVHDAFHAFSRLIFRVRMAL